MNCNDTGYVSIMFPGGFNPLYTNIGKYTIYLGSKTRSTDVKMHNWERWTEGSACKKSIELRELTEYSQFGHFSFIEAVKNLITSMTGQDFSKGTTGFRCTGNPLHRCNSSRQNNGGSASTNLNLLGFTVTTTAPLGRQVERNSYMMHQPTILYVQGVAIAHNLYNKTKSDMHFHTSCSFCCSDKDDLEQITCSPISVFPQYQWLGELLGYDPDKDKLRTNKVDLTVLEKKKITLDNLSFQMGLTHAFTISLAQLDRDDRTRPFIDRDIHDHLIVKRFMEGLRSGLWFAAYYSKLFMKIEFQDKEVFKKLSLEEVSRLLLSLHSNEDLRTCLLHKNVGEFFQRDMRGPTVLLNKGSDNIYHLFSEYVMESVSKEDFTKILTVWIL